MSKTIKQMADELNVSKQAIRDKIAKLGLHGSLQKIGNQLFISEEQENLIKASFIQSQSQSENAKKLCDNENQSQTTLQLISMLQRELDIKNKQIQELTYTVKAQAQSISADRHSELAEKLQETKLITDKSEKISRFERLKQFIKGT